jgi:hypothetical protein
MLGVNEGIVYGSSLDFQGKGIAIRSNLKEVRKYIEHIKSS